MVLFSATFFTLSLGIFTIIYYMKQYLTVSGGGGEPMLGYGEPTFWQRLFTPEVLGSISAIFLPVCIVLFSVAVWRYRKNKPQNL